MLTSRLAPIALATVVFIVGCGSDPAPLYDAGSIDGGPRDAGGPDSSPPDAGVSDSGPPDAGASDSGPLDAGASDSGVDAEAVDMSALDGGPAPPCSPIDHAGCASGARCAWVLLDPTRGAFLCVPDGSVAEGGACTTGPAGATTGYDDCARGLHCRDGACARVCDSAIATSCGAQACALYASFGNPDGETAGLCTPVCDLVTQQRPDGSTCGAGMGCYLVGATSVCATAMSALTQGQEVTGPASANACASGFTPVPNASGTLVCVAFCRPLETHSGATAGAGGDAPYACPDRGAAAPPNECIFGWRLSSSGGASLNAIGFCFDRTGRMYDSNADGMPDTAWPSCTTLANTDTNGDGTRDNEAFGCAPQPVI